MPSGTVVHIVDDDEAVRDSVKAVLGSAGYTCATYDSASAFLSHKANASGCALVDIRMPEMDGLTLQQEMLARGMTIPVVFMTGFADVSLAVRAMKAGAIDFVEKPCPRDILLDAVKRAAEQAKASKGRDSFATDARAKLERLTQREREVLELLVAGDANKVVAHKLAISPRTVEIHRARLMEKLQVKSLADLVRITIAAEH